MPKKVNASLEKANRFVELCNGDMELAQFLNEWLNNGKNATEAYKKVHPNVKHESASVLGSKLLGKISPAVIMREFGLTENLYFDQLYAGVNATKWNDFTGEREADHKTRKDYHDKMGKLLGIEKNEQQSPTVAVQINNLIDNQKQKYDL